MLKKIIYYSLILLSMINDSHALSISKKTNLVSLNIIPEYKIINKESKELEILAKIKIKDGWHLYWDNPGDVGDPTILTYFDTPYYKEIISTHTSPQKSIYEDIITSYIYKDTIYFKSVFKLKDLGTNKALDFKLNLSYTACKKECKKEEMFLDFSLPIDEKNTPNNEYIKNIIDAENTFPTPIKISTNLNKNILEIYLEKEILKSCNTPEFVSVYPKKNPLENLPSTISDDNKLSIDFNNITLPEDFKGTLICDEKSYELHESKNPTKKEDLIKNTTSFNPLLYYILTAFLAGLILNLMPCVLPVLSLKALYLINNSKSSNLVSALSYMAGVLCSFLGLAFILFELKELSLGWGFQLQSPLFNTILLVLFTLVFLNLLDIITLKGKCAEIFDKYARLNSFLTGFFAVLIACPCTGPFMGAAIGYAIDKEAVIYFSIFLSLGFGYALPYTLIELNPHLLARILPKPGAFMNTLKKILSIPVFLTMVWLALLIIKQMNFTSLENKKNLWESYSNEKIEQALNENKNVFIDFTADWCLICLMNDKTILQSKTFEKMIKEKDIKLFKADWTNKNQEITKALKKYNRESVPLYIYYSNQNKNKPVILPQLLTRENLKKYLK